MSTMTNNSNMNIRKLSKVLKSTNANSNLILKRLDSKVTGRIVSIVKSSLFIFLLLGIQACQDTSMQDLRNFVANAYKDKKPEIEPLPEIKPYKDFPYSASASNDPFNLENIITSRTAAAAVGDSPDSSRPREPLEEFPLDALKMVGTISQGQRPYVIVKTSEGTALRATIGNYMGQNDGKIKQIIPEEQKILLTEIVLDTAGRWVNRDVEMTIDKDE
ncbi:MAG: type IV pilus assembly protein PilP [Arenicella sp.]|jgi:type IV pilus assembly protein PilP